WSTTIGSVPLTGATAILASCTVSGCRAGTGTLTIAAGAMTQDFPVTIVPGPEARIDVSPPTGTVVAGGTLAFSGTPRDAFGNAISGLTVVWTVTGGIGTISAGGVLSASNLVGSGTVVASAGNAPQTTVAISVVPGAASRGTVDQSSLTMIAGATTTRAARVWDAYGTRSRPGTSPGPRAEVRCLACRRTTDCSCIRRPPRRVRTSASRSRPSASPASRPRGSRWRSSPDLSRRSRLAGPKRGLGRPGTPA